MYVFYICTSKKIKNRTMNYSMKDIENLRSELSGLSAEEIIKWSLDTFGHQNLGVASSLGAEDQVLTYYYILNNPKSRIFTLDTGRLNQETYSTMNKTLQKYNFKYEVLFPDTQKIMKLVSDKGPNSFYLSIDDRHECCNIRKVEPLKKKLSEFSIWVTGLRREQAVTRKNLEVLEWDDSNNLFKLNPLASWSEDDVWNFIKEKQIPYNSLHDKGYRSIGCAPCTRAIAKEDDVRAGRWWWENPEQKECGLHVK